MSDTAVKNRAALEMEREVANRIMALRVDSGYTQAEMADMTGFSLEDYTTRCMRRAARIFRSRSFTNARLSSMLRSWSFSKDVLRSLPATR